MKADFSAALMGLPRAGPLRGAIPLRQADLEPKRAIKPTSCKYRSFCGHLKRNSHGPAHSWVLGCLPSFLETCIMQFNERKMQALEIFTNYNEMRPPDWAVVAGFYPMRASFSYLLRLHRMGLLRRSRDWRERIVYRLSRHGARWLLRRLRSKV